MKFGRTGEQPRLALRDNSFRTVGVILVLLGFAAAIFGFVFLAGCNAYFNETCVGYRDLVGGVVLGTLGLVLLAGGAILYLVGRRAPRQAR